MTEVSSEIFMRYVVGADIGSSGSRAIVVDPHGNVISTARTEHSVITPKPGWAEIDPETLWNSLRRTVKKAILDSGVKPRNISCIGVAGFSPVPVLLNDKGKPLRSSLLYNDTRASVEMKELQEMLPDSISKTGNAVNSQMILHKLLWIRKHQRRIFEKIHMIHDATSYLVFQLTGRHVMDFSTASEGGLLHIRKKEWWNDGADAVGISQDKLPLLQPCHAVAGFLLGERSRSVGALAGTPVIAGVADAVASALSVGATNEGDTALTYGSTACVLHCSRVLRTSANMFVDLHCVPGKYVINGGMATAGSVLRWFRDNLVSYPHPRRHNRESSAYERLDQEASKLGPGSQGVLVLPYFSGERTPFCDPLARGVIFGLTLYHTAAHLHRALVESIAYGFRHNLESLMKIGCKPKRVIAADGGARSVLFREIVSNVLNRSQIYYPENRGAAAGAAFLAALGVGLLKDWASIGDWNKKSVLTKSDKRKHESYSKFYSLYLKLYADLAQDFKQLHALAG